MLRRMLAAVAAALVLFHVWLFAGQALAGELASPERLLRWLVAAGLLAVLTALHRRGFSLVRGRAAVGVWLLAALLHGPAIGARLEAVEMPAIPGVAEVLVPFGVAAMA